MPLLLVYTLVLTGTVIRLIACNISSYPRTLMDVRFSRRDENADNSVGTWYANYEEVYIYIDMVEVKSKAGNPPPPEFLSGPRLLSL